MAIRHGKVVNHHEVLPNINSYNSLKVVTATFLLVYFVCKESTCETRENVFYFTSKALFILEIIEF